MAGQSSCDPRSSPGPSPRAAREHQNLKRVPGATGRRAALAPADDAFPAPEERQLPEEGSGEEGALARRRRDGGVPEPLSFPSTSEC